MLLYSIGKDVEEDDTFEQEHGAIQCFTARFKKDEYLASFRNPFNSKNNMGYLHNINNEKLIKYFDFSDEIIAVNMIGTDFQDRNNSSDQDSDSIYVTNQTDIVECAKDCYLKYPTIVNNIPMEKNEYDNTPLNYATVDNLLASAQMAIGASSNLAQLALTYSYNYNNNKYNDYVCILSVLAQVAIDNAKRKYDIDINKEIKRIKKDMNIKENHYPIFWNNIKDNFNGKINEDLKCPMNYLNNIEFEDSRSIEETLPMKYFFNKYELKENRVKSKKVESLIEKYSFMQYKQLIKYGEDDYDDYFLLRSNFDKMLEDIKRVYISKDYLGLMSWLIDRAFLITPNIKSNKSNIKNTTDYNKSLLLKVLYDINSENLLKCFSNNIKAC